MRTLFVVLPLLCLGAVPKEAPKPAAGGRGGFEQLKRLEGSWKAEGKDGTTFLSLSVVSGGSALFESVSGKDRAKVTTGSAYHLDGDALVMTHYAQGNQPRMRATEITPQRIRFDAFEVQNLKDAKASHVAQVTWIIKDSDHFAQEWVNSAGGKQQTHTLEFTREYVDTLR